MEYGEGDVALPRASDAGSYLSGTMEYGEGGASDAGSLLSDIPYRPISAGAGSSYSMSPAASSHAQSWALAEPPGIVQRGTPGSRVV